METLTPQQRLRARRKLAGLCSECPSPTLPGLSTCGAHRNRRRPGAGVWTPGNRGRPPKNVHQPAQNVETRLQTKARLEALIAAPPRQPDPEPTPPSMYLTRCGIDAAGNSTSGLCHQEITDRSRWLKAAGAGRRYPVCADCQGGS